MSTTTQKKKVDWHSLADVPTGHSATLANAHTDSALRHRLAELGIRPGAKLNVVQRTAGGGRVIDLGAMRYAIDSATLKKLEVVS